MCTEVTNIRLSEVNAIRIQKKFYVRKGRERERNIH